MVPLKDVQGLTGYIRGGVTALACKKNYPVLADEQIRALRADCGISRGSRHPDRAGPRRLSPRRPAHTGPISRPKAT